MVTTRHGDALIQRLSDLDRTAEERGEDAYELLQEMFRGYPISNLIALLRSEAIGAVESGIWILSELGGEAAPLIGEIESLLESQSRKVRYWAIDVVHSSAGSEDGRIIGKAFGLTDDIDIAVRRAALFFLARASESQLSAAIAQLGESKIGLLVSWLIQTPDSDTGVEDIVHRLASDDRLVRMFAVAAAARIASRDRSVLERAAAMDDNDIGVFATRELERSRL